MILPINEEFIDICHEIVGQEKTNSEWALVESGDMFQTKSFCGGFDADEMAFCFSFFDDVGAEYWFQLTLEQVSIIADGGFASIEIRPAE